MVRISGSHDVFDRQGQPRPFPVPVHRGRVDEVYVVKPSDFAVKANVGKLRRPLSARVYQRARRLAKRYRFLVEPDGDRYVARALEYPEAVGVGTDPESALRQAVELATTGVAVLLEARRPPPGPCAR